MLETVVSIWVYERFHVGVLISSLENYVLLTTHTGLSPFSWSLLVVRMCLISARDGHLIKISQ